MSKININGGDLNRIIHLSELYYQGESFLVDDQVILKNNIFEKLKGFTIEISDIDGDHRNDGQLVDYTFMFTSPSGKKTFICTEMCLMVGWNFPTHKTYDIKID